MYKLNFDKKVFKFFQKHKGDNILSSFKSATLILKNSPYENNLDIKKLKGEFNKYRLRIGGYRFLYEIIDDKILIYFYDAGSRGGIYK